jgi:hypothetical protein
MRRSFRLWLAVGVGLIAGCTSPSALNWETLKGPGFPGWSQKQSARNLPGAPAPKPSGFFTDRRSEQIEQDLGGY